MNLVILKLSVLEASLLWLAEESLQRRYSQQIQIQWVNQIDSFHVIKLSYTYYDLFFKWNCTTLICYLALIIQYLWIPHKPMANFMVATVCPSLYTVVRTSEEQFNPVCNDLWQQKRFSKTQTKRSNLSVDHATHFSPHQNSWWRWELYKAELLAISFHYHCFACQKHAKKHTVATRATCRLSTR